MQFMTLERNVVERKIALKIELDMHRIMSHSISEQNAVTACAYNTLVAVAVDCRWCGNGAESC